MGVKQRGGFVSGIVLSDPGSLAQHLHERPERDAAAQRQATAAENLRPDMPFQQATLGLEGES